MTTVALPRVLPSPTSPAWDDPDTVRRIVDYTDRVVCPEAHKQAHPVPQPDCPFGACADVTGPVLDRGSEAVWWEKDNRPTTWGGRVRQNETAT